MEQIFQAVEKASVKRDILREALAKAIKALNKEKIELEAIIEARSYLQLKAKETQDLVKINIEDLLNKAINTVFPEYCFTLAMNFEMRRGKTECDILLYEYGKPIDPVKNCGGGIADIMSFALQLISIRLSNNRPLLIMDQPFSNVDENHKAITYEMVKAFCKEMAIQLIAVSHDKKILDIADKIFKVSKADTYENYKISTVYQEKT